MLAKASPEFNLLQYNIFTTLSGADGPSGVASMGNTRGGNCGVNLSTQKNIPIAQKKGPLKCGVTPRAQEYNCRAKKVPF